MRVLLTGGSGFIAAHVLDYLLKDGHSVVTTVRSQAKADKIREAHSKYAKDKLDFAIVQDIAQPDAFEHAVKSDPPFESVIHTASPFHFNTQDIQKDLLDPAIIGTTGILKSIKASAPTVKRVVITSSFAAMFNPYKGHWPEHTYNEADWSPLTHEQALESNAAGYRASKLFAEKAAWDFVEKEKPNFDLVTMCPPLVIGPIVHYLNSLESLNTSNQRTRDCIQGKWKTEVADTGLSLWIDVRDLAVAHVRAIEVAGASNKRFFVTSGYFSNSQIADVVRKNFPAIKDVPDASVPGGKLPEPLFKIDNSRTKDVLDLKFTPFENSITDLVKSLQTVGA